MASASHQTTDWSAPLFSEMLIGSLRLWPRSLGGFFFLSKTVDEGMEFMSTRVTGSQSPSESGRKDGRGPVRASLTISKELPET
jgi:hypothetical protein